MKRWVLIVGLATSGLAAADAPSDAERFYNDGQTAFAAKQFDAALTAWQKSFALSNEPELLFDIGQAFRLRAQDGDCAKALDAYEKFITLDAASTQRTVAEAFAAEMRACVARTPPRREAPPPPRPTPRVDHRAQRIAGISIAGGGVLLGAVGIYFGHRATSLADEVTSACAGGCTWATEKTRDAAGSRAQTLGWIFDAAGAAALVGGGIAYLLGTGEHAQPVAIVPRRDGAAITWSGSW